MRSPPHPTRRSAPRIFPSNMSHLLPQVLLIDTPIIIPIPSRDIANGENRSCVPYRRRRSGGKSRKRCERRSEEGEGAEGTGEDLRGGQHLATSIPFDPASFNEESFVPASCAPGELCGCDGGRGMKVGRGREGWRRNEAMAGRKENKGIFPSLVGRYSLAENPSIRHPHSSRPEDPLTYRSKDREFRREESEKLRQIQGNFRTTTNPALSTNSARRISQRAQESAQRTAASSPSPTA